MPKSIHAAFALVSLVLAAAAYPAQSKSTMPQPEKSSDPAILWQFDTHG